MDILINNAGIAGAEEMVVDMPLAAWEHTLSANLVSNYSLIRKLAPYMKAAGRGKILNVSSYFGGEKYVAVPYPNRADYAVSKAGQRALAEILSRHLGPEIQINALAPGPVEGARLRGGEERPGLFARRGRLVLENKRLNAVHGALLGAIAGGTPRGDALALLAINAVPRLSAHARPAGALHATARRRRRAETPPPPARSTVLDLPMARKLVRRLQLAPSSTTPPAARRSSTRSSMRRNPSSRETRCGARRRTSATPSSPCCTCTRCRATRAWPCPPCSTWPMTTCPARPSTPRAG